MPVLGILVDLNRSFRSHPSAEALEELALGRLPEAITGQIEEHLLLCRECQNTLAEIDTFISAFRAADANDPWEDLQRPLARRPGSVESEHDRAGIVTERFGWSLLPSIAMRKTSIAPVLVLATFVLLMIRTTPPDHQPPVGVSLTSMRTGADVFAQAPAGKPLRLSFDAPGLRVEEGSRLEIVDGAG